MSVVIGAIIPAVLLTLAAHRIRSNRHGSHRGTHTGITNPLTQLLLLLGLAKLCRVPVLTDDVINPVLRDATGVANVMSLAGMTFGALSAIPILGVSSYITGRNLVPRAQLGIAVVIVVAMITTFLRTPMADTPTSYMSNDFAVTGPVMAYWVAFLAPLASALVLGSGLYSPRAVVGPQGPIRARVGRYRPVRGVGVGVLRVQGLQPLLAACGDRQLLASKCPAGVDCPRACSADRGGGVGRNLCHAHPEGSFSPLSAVEAFR
ncbi:hypothetical protein [Nocardia crassostreae]|uniref:hypothetical protein n=1 Tax=Nocardia crassostreae TaxID=53428 RepID=UPI000AD52386|nr:hypothetical protein [Nocardia crassostreae]